MSFWYLQFSQKTNENNSTWGTMVVKSNSFVRFLGEFKIPNRHFENNGPLDQAVWDQCFNGSCLDLWTWVMLRIISPKNKTNNELNKVDVLQFQKYTFFIQARGLKILYHSFFLKGQLISEGLFCILNSPKKRTKKLLYYYNTLFSFVFWEKLKNQKDISKLTDL